MSTVPEPTTMRRAKLIDEVGPYQFVQEALPRSDGYDRNGEIRTLQGDQRDTTAKLGDEGSLRWHRLKGGKNRGEWRFAKD